MPEPYSEEGYALMGAAFEVHNIQGGGLLEATYQEKFEMESELRKIPYHCKKELKIFYKGRELRERYTPNLRVFGEIVVEMKAISALAPA